MKTPTSIVATSILAGLLLASCQSHTPKIAPPPSVATKVAPLPSWTKQAGKKGTRSNSRKVKFSSKLIEITREPGSPDTHSPAVQKNGLNLSGVLTNAGFQIYMRAISQKKGSDIMTSPPVVSYEGETAKVQVARQIVYPNPAKPSESIKDQTGVTQFFRARSRDGGKTYELDVLAQVKELLKFQKLPNGSEQPIFKTRRINNSLRIENGHTAIFSGLVTDSQRSVEDKVPFLGSIPLIGRAFTKKTTETFQTKLILAVTAERIR
jgi:type II secretory pathway component GspD/PulD (secretin)